MFIHDRNTAIDALETAGFDRFEIEDIIHNLTYEIVQTALDNVDVAKAVADDFERSLNAYSDVICEVNNLLDECMCLKMSAKLRDYLTRISKELGAL